MGRFAKNDKKIYRTLPTNKFIYFTVLHRRKNKCFHRNITINEIEKNRGNKLLQKRQ